MLPIANLVSYCEASWKKVFISQESCPDFMGGINQKNHLCCGGRSYVQLIRRVLRSEEIGVVVLGTLKVSNAALCLKSLQSFSDLVCDCQKLYVLLVFWFQNMYNHDVYIYKI